MATMSFKIKPFQVPSEVQIELPSTGLRQDGFKPALASIKLEQLDVQTAEAMIEEFAAAVLAAVMPPASVSK